VLKWAQTSAKASNLNQKWSKIQDSNLDFLTNPDLDQDVCWIVPKMLCSYNLVSVSDFAECRENWLVTVWEMLINLLKSPILRWRGKWKSDPESVCRTASPPKVNQFFQSVLGRPTHNTKFQWNRLLLLQQSCSQRQNEWWSEWQTDLITKPPPRQS